MPVFHLPRRPIESSGFALSLALIIAMAFVGAAAAEEADRNQPMVVEADRPGSVDLQRNVVVFSGNVVVTQGSLVLRADRVETRELPDGYRAATATGTAGHQATWHQRRSDVDETVEGTADRIDYDGRADTVHLSGNSEVRQLRGGAVANQINGGTIVWNNVDETFKVEGGAVSATNPGGRVRDVLSPRADPASAPSSAGKAPGKAASGATPRPPPGAAALLPSRSLQERP